MENILRLHSTFVSANQACGLACLVSAVVSIFASILFRKKISYYLIRYMIINFLCYLAFLGILFSEW